MFFLNLCLCTHLVAVYRESQLRNGLAEKYFKEAPPIVQQAPQIYNYQFPGVVPQQIPA